MSIFNPKVKDEHPKIINDNIYNGKVDKKLYIFDPDNNKRIRPQRANLGFIDSLTRSNNVKLSTSSNYSKELSPLLKTESTRRPTPIANSLHHPVSTEGKKLHPKKTNEGTKSYSIFDFLTPKSEPKYELTNINLAPKSIKEMVELKQDIEKDEETKIKQTKKQVLNDIISQANNNRKSKKPIDVKQESNAGAKVGDDEIETRSVPLGTLFHKLGSESESKPKSKKSTKSKKEILETIGHSVKLGAINERFNQIEDSEVNEDSDVKEEQRKRGRPPTLTEEERETRLKQEEESKTAKEQYLTNKKAILDEIKTEESKPNPNYQLISQLKLKHFEDAFKYKFPSDTIDKMSDDIDDIDTILQKSYTTVSKEELAELKRKINKIFEIYDIRHLSKENFDTIKKKYEEFNKSKFFKTIIAKLLKQKVSESKPEIKHTVEIKPNIHYMSEILDSSSASPAEPKTPMK
jgi:hypothetical protein